MRKRTVSLRQFLLAHTIYGLEISKIIFNYTHLTRGLYKAVLLFSVCSFSLQCYAYRYLFDPDDHTGQCKSIGGCYNELVVAIFRTRAGIKGKKKIYTCCLYDLFISLHLFYL